MKQIELTVTVRNNLLKTRRKELGLSQKKLALAVGVPMSFLTDMEQLKKRKGPQNVIYQEKLASFFECCVDDLFPKELDSVKKNKTIKFVDVDECRKIISNTAANEKFLLEQGITSDSLFRKEVVNKTLNELSEKEKRIIDLRFGLSDGYSRTLKEVGEILHRSKDGVRQIEARAIRKLRHPSRSRFLREVL